MKKPSRILIVENIVADAHRAKRTIRKELKSSEFQIVETRKDFLEALKTFQPDVILADNCLPGFDGMKSLKLARKHCPLTPFILWTDAKSEDAAIKCLKAGAHNYVFKRNIKRLGPAMLHALEERRLLLQRQQAEERCQAIFENSVVGIFQSSPEGRYISVNAAMARIYGYDSPPEMMDAIKNIPNQVYVEPHKRAEFTALLQSRGTIENYEQTNYRKDGSIIWTSTSARAVRDLHGNVLYYEGFLTDISARKQAEQSLQERERQLSILFSNLPGPVYRCLNDSDYTVEFISDGIAELSGYQSEDFRQHHRHFGKIIHADDKERVWVEIQKAVESKRPFEVVYRIITATGDEKWVWDRGQGIWDAEGQLQALEGFITDITERRRAEEALRESQIKYQNLVETSHDLIWSTDAAGRITFMNRASREIYGYEPEELIGRSFFELLDSQYYRPEDFNTYREMLVNANEFHGIESYVRHRDGRQIILSANSILTRDEQGNVTGILGSSHDITMHKRVEEVLKRERNLLRTLIDNLPDRIYAMDTQGRKILSNTADWKASGGKFMEDVIGKTDFDLYPTELANEFWQLDQAVLESGLMVINHEEPGLDEEGQRVSILTTKIPLRNEEGCVTGLVGIGRDITERKQAEARMNDLLTFNEKILTHSPLGILTYKLTGECIFANENAALITGTSVEQLQSQNFHKIESWKKSGLYDLAKQAIATQNAVTADVHIISTFGKDLWMTAHCVTFQAKDELHLLLTITDITDRQQAEERVRQSENRYRLAIKATNDVVWEWSPQTNQLFWSENALILFGYAAEEIGPDAKWWDERIHPDDRERVVTKLDRFIHGQESLWLEEYRFRRKNGSYAYISDRGYVERDANGVPLRLIGAMSDITSRKQAELERQALLEIMQGLAHTNDLQELLTLIHHSIAEVIYAENFFVVLHQQNSGLFEEIYSVDQYDAPAPPSKMEKSITSYVFRSEEPLLLTQARFDELTAQNEVQLIGTNSKSWLGVPLRTSGRTIGVMAVQDYNTDNRYSERDKDFLTSIAAQIALAIERKQAEQALRENEEHYRAIFEGVQDAIFVESLDGRILMVNERACEMFGYDRVEFLTKTVSDLVPEGHPILMADGVDSPALSVEPRETINQRANGEHFPIEISGRILVINGESVLLVVVSDITERKQSETALRESITRFRTLFEASPDAIMLIDPTDDWPIIDCNTAACQMNGYSHEELIGQPIDILNAVPSDLERRGEYLESIRQAGVLHYETLHRRRDGMLITVETSTSIIQFGKHDIILGIDRDATERKRVEAAEREQRALAEALRDTAETLSSTLDYGEVLDHILTAVGRVVPHDAASILLVDGDSTQMVRSHGYDKGGNDSGLVSVKLRLAESANLQQMLETRQPVVVYDTHSYAGWRRMSSTDWLRSNVGAPISIYGEVIGFICLDSQTPEFFTSVHAERLQAFANQAALAIHNAHLLQQAQAEIVERKLAEKELRASEERFRQLASNIQEVFWMTDAETNEEIYTSPAAERIWGSSTNAMMQEPDAFINSVLPEDRPTVLQAIEREKQGEKVEVEYRIMRPDGSLRWVWDRAFPIAGESGSVKRIAGISADITERKRAEEELRRRAEETSALLETSLALTNLDLKATLRTISNSAKSLFAADGCRIFLMEPDGETLRCVLALQESFEAFSDLKIKIGEGVTGAVAASGRAEIVNDMQNDSRSVQVPGTPEKEEEAIMFAPLKERDRTIGVLSIRRMGGSERYFQPADLELLEAFAAMAASSVSNARLFEETQRRLAELEALYENGLAVGRLLKPGDIGNRVIETFARYLRWQHVTIRLRREANDDLELVAFNVPNLKEEQRLQTELRFRTGVNRVGRGLSGYVIQTGEPLRTGDVHAHPQYINTFEEIRSGLYMPLKVGERAIGVISVESEIPNAFSEEDERLLATLASQAAIAFENARLYEAVQKELVERKRAEEALRGSEAHYRELADSITDILFELDHNLHYTHWNKASEVLTGIPVSDAIGKSMHDVFGESAEQSRIGKIYAEVLNDRQPRTFETTMIVVGAKRSFEINAYPSTRGVSVVAKDITDRKRTETIMQKRFELMEYSAHHTLNELMQKTTDEVSELTGSSIGFFHFMEADQINLGIQTWSTNALQLFHVPTSQGTHLPMDQAGVWAEAVRQRRPLIQNDYESLSQKKQLPEGHIRIAREMVIPILRSDKVVAVMGIANKPQDYTPHDLEIAERLADYAWDITERKQMENALAQERNQLARRVEERTADLSRANSNLARALRVKDEFLANMSHELRTPLNAILGLSESLGEQIAGPLNEKQQKYITTISESGHHLLALINDILDLAKIEAGQITLDINKVDIHSVCQSSLRMIKQLAQKKNQEVTLSIESGLGLMWADERRLKQMIVNLLGNAVKFTPENGKLGLEVHGDREANKITITVWDKGIGIKEDELARLFQPFVQLDSGLAREATGTGLGLALVAQMARLHGGSVNAVSEPSMGSRFSIVLPWEPALTLDSATRLRITGKFRAIKPDETNRPTILLVEDTKEVIMMIQDYLELAGYKIVTAQDGVDAIVQAKLVHPDLILMDVQMPRMDGLEATRRLRSEPEFRYTPIIALTALAMPNDRERCLAAGMDEYISKPINLKALVRIIQSCLFSRDEMKPR
ncbi:MAG TPA: PAS domain S-box protein [Anaerolineales bacterium]|nr:PAS domain S-box protein [Anaerolineales bacterium]